MNRLRARSVAVLVAVAALVASACTSDGIEITIGDQEQNASPGPVEPKQTDVLRVKPVHTGEATSAGAMKALCISPTPVSTSDGSPPGDTPASIEGVETQVESVRGLEYLEPVIAEPVTQDRIADELTRAFDDTYPKAFYDRRTAAWQTMGVIPDDITIREALLAFQTGQVVGFYNPVDGELVYLSDDDELDLTERYTLAHELTHAMDDQHFDLKRIDGILADCSDEEFQAALGTVEGSAQFFATRVVLEFPDPDAGLGDAGGGGLPDGVPPFMVDLQLWPYTAGQAFITALDERGSLEAIDGALDRFPISTEQIIHPERYPDDRPTMLDVGDLSDELGNGWGDLDVMVVGEQWLNAMLALELDGNEAREATAGWDGGVYRAWTDGTDVAIVLSTAWDSDEDAVEFADAMDEWLVSSGIAGSVGEPQGARVRVGFATSEEALAVVTAA